MAASACRGPAPAPPSPHRDNGPDGSVPAADTSTADPKTAKDKGPFFYKGRDYGSDATFGPLDVVFNKGFAIAQWEGRGRNIFSFQYGWDALIDSFRYPGPLAKKAGGWKEVLAWQVVPFARQGWSKAQWMPNYFGHIVEGGIVYRRMREWYEFHGVPLPSVTAFLTTYASALINEAYEMPVGAVGTEGGNIGSSMDLMVFDPLGVLLFQQDFVARFFGRTLHGAVWSSQASITIPEALLVNNGESVVFKPRMPFTDKARFFLRGGVGIEAGVSIHRGDGTDLSLAAGSQSARRWLDPYTELEYASFAFCASAWLDRDGNLLAGLTYDSGTDRRIGLNIYPGFVKVAGAAVGGWFLLDAKGRPFIGFSTSRTLGAGLGIGF